MEGLISSGHSLSKPRLSPQKSAASSMLSKQSQSHPQVGTVILYGVPIVSLVIESQERLCLAQISNTLLKQFSYNEIHNRRVALGITCVQCTPVQLEILRRAGAMPVSSRRCGMITRREAERLCKSFLGDNAPPRLPDDFAFSVHHECAWGCRGAFLPSRYNSSRAKCIKCSFCGLFFSPNKFIFHSHRTSPNAAYVQPDAANFNSWRRHMKLSGSPPENITHAWEDVKAMFNGGTRKRMLSSSSSHHSHNGSSIAKSEPISSPTQPKQIKMDSPPPTPVPYPPPTPTPGPLTPHRVPPFTDLPLPLSMMDYVWTGMESMKPPFLPPYLPWFGAAKRSVMGFSALSSIGHAQDSLIPHMNPLSGPPKLYHQSAFRPVFPAIGQSNYPEDPKRSSLSDIPRKIRIPRKDEFVPKRRDLEDHRVPLQKPRDNYEHVDSERNERIQFKSESNDDSLDSNDSLTKEVTSSPYERLPIKTLYDRESPCIPESILKFHPNILEATSNMASDDRRSYSKMIAVRDKNDNSVAEDYSTRRKLSPMRSDESPLEENAVCDDEDETVDIETTDESTPKDAEKNSASCPSDVKNETEKEKKPDESRHRIWTIARFSLEDPVRYSEDANSKKYREENDVNCDGGLNLSAMGSNKIETCTPVYSDG